MFSDIWLLILYIIINGYSTPFRKLSIRFQIIYSGYTLAVEPLTKGISAEMAARASHHLSKSVS